MVSRLIRGVAHSKPVNNRSAAYRGITRSKADVLRLESKPPFFRLEAERKAFRTSPRVVRSGSLGECLSRAGVQQLCQGDIPKSETRSMKGILVDSHAAHRKQNRQTSQSCNQRPRSRKHAQAWSRGCTLKHSILVQGSCCSSCAVGKQRCCSRSEPSQYVPGSEPCL